MGPLLRTIVVDCDMGTRAAVRRLLADIPSVTVVGEYASVPEALRQAPALRADVVVVEIPPEKGAKDGDGWSTTAIE